MRTESLDRFLGAVGEVILSTSQLRSVAGGTHLPADLSAGFDCIERRVHELQRRVMDLRTTPLLRVMDALPRAARKVAESAGKRVEVELRGTELELDRSILDRLSDPLLHLVRNAVDHGLEAPAERLAAGKPEVGRLIIEARRERDAILVEVRDDGAGIDLESVKRRAVDAGWIHADLADDLPPEGIAALVFRPGLSTREEVSEVSGRGVGMDAVRTTIESLGGSVDLWSERGVGTATTLIVPITAAVQRVLVVGVGADCAALPIVKVERILELPPSAVEHSGGESFALIDDEPLPVLSLAATIRAEGQPDTGTVMIVLVEIRGERVALLVDRVVGQQEIYVKPVPELLSEVRLLAGMTVLGDGSAVFLLDLNHLA